MEVPEVLRDRAGEVVFVPEHLAAHPRAFIRVLRLGPDIAVLHGVQELSRQQLVQVGNHEDVVRADVFTPHLGQIVPRTPLPHPPAGHLPGPEHSGRVVLHTLCDPRADDVVVEGVGNVPDLVHVLCEVRLVPLLEEKGLWVPPPRNGSLEDNDVVHNGVDLLQHHRQHVHLAAKGEPVVDLAVPLPPIPVQVPVLAGRLSPFGEVPVAVPHDVVTRLLPVRVRLVEAGLHAAGRRGLPSHFVQGGPRVPPPRLRLRLRPAAAHRPRAVCKLVEIVLGTRQARRRSSGVVFAILGGGRSVWSGRGRGRGRGRGDGERRIAGRGVGVVGQLRQDPLHVRGGDRREGRRRR
mmetsp:Transcript_5609/g.13686  ORF Transcript_5609/g.13686 Transcript_5609/m.13686 type:complete len:349 (+) Transcript_5609:602-1648(+)